MIKQRVFPGMDLDQPEIDLVRVTKGFGVEALRVEQRDDLRKAFKYIFSERRPFLIDVVVDRTVKPFLA